MAFTERHLTCPPPSKVNGARVKWYHVHHAEPGGIDAAVLAAADAALPELVTAETAAFAVLHQARTGAFLSVFNWVWDNVLEFNGVAAGVPWIGCLDDDPTHFAPLPKPWIGCVFELVVLEHERAAWVEHVLEPEVAALDAYLADSHAEGPVGR